MQTNIWDKKQLVYQKKIISIRSLFILIWFEVHQIGSDQTNTVTYYKPITIVNDDSTVINKLETSLTDGARVIIYDHHMFIVQATSADQRVAGIEPLFTRLVEQLFKLYQPIFIQPM